MTIEKLQELIDQANEDREFWIKHKDTSRESYFEGKMIAYAEIMQILREV